MCGRPKFQDKWVKDTVPLLLDSSLILRVVVLVLRDRTGSVQRSNPDLPVLMLSCLCIMHYMHYNAAYRPMEKMQPARDAKLHQRTAAHLATNYTVGLDLCFTHPLNPENKKWHSVFN